MTYTSRAIAYIPDHQIYMMSFDCTYYTSDTDKQNMIKISIMAVPCLARPDVTLQHDAVLRNKAAHFTYTFLIEF